MLPVPGADRSVGGRPSSVGPSQGAKGHEVLGVPQWRSSASESADRQSVEAEAACQIEQVNEADPDQAYMGLALRLAAKANWATHPNPMVGAVVVNGRPPRIVGQGYHHRPGEAHAEVLALQAAGGKARGGTLYVTLEPCCHSGKRTPPCVPTVIRAGLRRVVVAMRDPNPQVCGRGIRELRAAGVRVTVGCLQRQAETLNAPYCHRLHTGRPYVILKGALTLDGKIATADGESKWITGQQARRHVHRMRSHMDALMIGIGTVLHDDPQLTARVPTRRAAILKQPWRVVLDSRLRISIAAKIVVQRDARTIVATTRKAPVRRVDRLRSLGITVLQLPRDRGHVSLDACLRWLGQEGVTTVMLEGGSTVNASALSSGMVNRILFYVAPRLLGGQDAKGIIGGASPARLADAVSLSNLRVRRLGPDLLIDAAVKRTDDPTTG